MMHDPVHFGPEEKGVFFSFQHSDFKLSNPTPWKTWITKCIEKSITDFFRLDYIFCTDNFLLDINERYLSHDSFTDIITFCLSENPIHGEIYISIDRVRENAKDLSLTFDKELKRVMAHGMLHLAGFSDKTAKEIETMRKKESEYIALWI